MMQPSSSCLVLSRDEDELLENEYYEDIDYDADNDYSH